MATSDKDIIITPNKWAASGTEPEIAFTGSTVGSASTIKMVAVGRTDRDAVVSVLAPDDGDNIAAFSEDSSGSLLSVTDDSGITKFEINDSGNVNLSANTGALGMPVGFTTDRPETPQAGYTRWNTNAAALEVYTGTSWVSIVSDYFPSGSTVFGSGSGA